MQPIAIDIHNMHGVKLICGATDDRPLHQKRSSIHGCMAVSIRATLLPLLTATLHTVYTHRSMPPVDASGRCLRSMPPVDASRVLVQEGVVRLARGPVFAKPKVIVWRQVRKQHLTGGDWW